MQKIAHSQTRQVRDSCFRHGQALDTLRNSSSVAVCLHLLSTGAGLPAKGAGARVQSCFKVTRGPRVGGQAQIPVAQLGRPGAHPHHWPFTGASAKSRTANSTHSELRVPNMAAKALRPRHLLLLVLVCACGLCVCMNELLQPWISHRCAICKPGSPEVQAEVQAE